MIGRNTKNKRKKNCFRSYTNIHNYNNFLLELDEMQKQKMNDISNIIVLDLFLLTLCLL